MLQNAGKRALRRGWFIHGYCGANGFGKSAAMVWDTIPSLEAGRPVLGTVRLTDYRNPRECEDDECEADPDSGHYVRQLPEPHIVEALFAVQPDPVERVRQLATLGEISHVHQAAHPLWVPLKVWDQVLEARGMDLLLDEVTGAASSRESASLPAAIANKLVQLRRNDVVVRWSAPSWGRADKIIRECSQAVTHCVGYLAKPSGDAQRQVRQRRLFRWRTYDADLFEDFTSGKRQELSALVNDWHWGPRSPAFAAYDTFDAVLTVGTVNESGRCYRCGGTRRAPACSCRDTGSDKGVQSPGVSARGPRLRGATDIPGSGDPAPVLAPVEIPALTAHGCESTPEPV